MPVAWEGNPPQQNQKRVFLFPIYSGDEIHQYFMAIWNGKFENKQ
jgi:hypothetical protein